MKTKKQWVYFKVSPDKYEFIEGGVYDSAKELADAEGISESCVKSAISRMENFGIWSRYQRADISDLPD